jgi:hypothetical protein
MPRTSDSIRSQLATGQALVHSANTATHTTVHTTINYSRDMVYMEGSSLQSETLNSTAPETDGGNGID